MKKTTALKLNKNFRFLYYKGGSEVSKTLVFYFKKNKSGANRLGITVSKKVGKAVTRNRVRRLIKENYRLRENSIKDGYDVVIVARTRAAESDFLKIGRDMQFLLRKCDLLNEKAESEID